VRSRVCSGARSGGFRGSEAAARLGSMRLLPKSRAGLACLLTLAAWAAAAEELTCDAKAGGKGCIADNADGSCAEQGFDSLRLSCNTCRQLGSRLEATGNSNQGLVAECLKCCREPGAVERFSSARLICDANIQDRDQDLHDFIKRKAPLFPELEVEYSEAAEPALELEKDDGSGRVLRAVVAGWKSDHLAQFLGVRLEQKNNTEGDEGGAKMVAKGAFSAEVQTCSG